MNNVYELICRAVEQSVGYSPKTPKDFDRLSDDIFARLHQKVSPTTLKRLWGYVASDAVPRQSTLDLLALFVGSDDYAAFCRQHEAAQHEAAQPEAVSHEALQPQPAAAEGRTAGRHDRMKWGGAGLMLIIALAAAYALLSRPSAVAGDDDGDSPYVITLGQRFGSYDDYLTLFGIQADDTLWGQRLPHHPYISVWSPQWRHWRWHNDGDSALLLPTITEHWEPDDGSADSMLVAVRNNDHYLAQRDLNELRITFVRGLTPDGDSLTFCGVYRMDLAESNFHHVTWRRVADRIDLEHLDYLEQLRN